ncbi:MAG TPA: hypothetical protein VNP73_02360, partial [Actinomycetota bacterium]|nr:hypothetical protein [Actinomycetota bacterium]
KLAGLGNGDVKITVSATGRAEKITCTNKGGNQAPGQNKPRVATVGQTTIPSNQVKNGSVTFSVTTVGPGLLDGKTAGCPNSNWTGRIDDVSFSSATVKVEQGGSVVLNKTFSP